jgi:hypothetical protein
MARRLPKTNTDSADPERAYADEPRYTVLAMNSCAFFMKSWARIRLE